MNKHLEPLQHWWAALAPRERLMLRAALLSLLVLATWTWALQPAISTLRAAPEQRAQAQAALDRLQAWATEAGSLRGTAAASGATQEPQRTQETGLDDPTRTLVMAALGDSARIEAQGRHVTITFDGVSGEQARQALRTLRSRLQAQLIEAELAPSQEGLRGRFRFEWTAG